jgi:hypothetical protein
MKKIITLSLLLLACVGCYVPSGMYRMTEVRFNGVPQPDDDCVVMIVQNDVLTCQKEKK